VLAVTDAGESLVLEAGSLRRKFARRYKGSATATFHATEHRLLVPRSSCPAI